MLENKLHFSNALKKVTTDLEIVKASLGSRAEAVIEIESDAIKGVIDLSPSCPLRLALV
jgi:hypothetical protein